MLGSSFSSKYKQQKLTTYNLTNLLHSVVAQLSHSAFVRLFHDFLTSRYSFQEFVYFLFIRSSTERELSINFVKVAERKEKVASTEGMRLTVREVGKVIKAIAGDDRGVLHQLRHLLRTHLTENGIELRKLYHILLQDYQAKRVARGQAHSGSAASGKNEAQP